MLKKVLNVFAKWLMRKTSAVKVEGRVRLGSVAEKHNESIITDLKDQRSVAKTGYDQIDISRIIEDIQAGIIAKGYKAIPDILSEYDDVIVKNFVIMQLNALGQYDPEKDNLELSKDKLIDMAMELNRQQFVQRMKEQGKASMTKAQKEIIEKLWGRQNVPADKRVMPSDRFEASELIDKLIKNIPQKTMKGNITEGQFKAIESLCTKLQKNAGLHIGLCKNVKDASDMISMLSAEVEKAGLNSSAMCSDAQIEYIKRMCKMLHKRLTEKKETELRAKTAKEISELIGKMQEQCKALPEYNAITKGQVDYIISLCNTMNLPVSVDDIKKLTKQEATKKIDALRRDYLYMLYKGTGTQIERKDIDLLDSEAVKKCIEQLREENKLKDYKEVE
jgi:hypothetical protein